MTITPELKSQVAQFGFARLEDEATGDIYRLTKEQALDRIYEDFAKQFVIAEGIQKSQDAFFRDLPELLQNRKWLGKWVAYGRGERVKIGKTKIEVARECVKRGLQDSECAFFVIRERSREPEEITYPGSW